MKITKTQYDRISIWNFSSWRQYKPRSIILNVPPVFAIKFHYVASSFLKYEISSSWPRKSSICFLSLNTLLRKYSWPWELQTEMPHLFLYVLSMFLFSKMCLSICFRGRSVLKMKIIYIIWHWMDISHQSPCKYWIIGHILLHPACHDDHISEVHFFFFVFSGKICFLYEICDRTRR